MKKIIVVSGGFDPIHSGHISYLSEKNSDKLIVALIVMSGCLQKKEKTLCHLVKEKLL